MPVGSFAPTPAFPRTPKLLLPCPSAPAVLNGVLVFRDLAAQDDAEPQAILIAAAIQQALPDAIGRFGVLWALLFAFAGGLLLNLMPCVLPVLSIKTFGLVRGP